MQHSAIVRAFSIWVAGAAAASALGAAQTFDFKDPKGVNTISFTLDSQLEPILGLAAGVSGKVTFDPAEPKKTTGKIAVEASSVQTMNKKMNEVLHSADWLDVAKHPTVEFSFKDVKEVKSPRENVFEMTVAGEFTCRGVTKPLTVTVLANYLPGKLATRLRGEGDLLVLRSDFTIKRADFNIKADQPGGLVADDIRIQAAIVGSCAKQ